MTTSRAKHALWLLLMAAAGGTLQGGCGDQGAAFWDRQRRDGAGLDNRTIREVLRQDLDDLADIPDVRAASSTAVGEAFGRVFGGYDGHAVRSFIDARLKHYLTPNDRVHVWPNPDTFKHQDWLSAPKPKINPVSGLPDPDAPDDAPSGPLGVAVVRGSNIGTALWMQARVNQSSMAMRLHGQWVRLDSSRVGVMLIGEAYRLSAFVDDDVGREIFFEAGTLARQEVLVHEARHSDCTGGLWERDLELARRAPDREAFITQAGNRQCGHMHVMCKEGVLRGQPACDGHPWGAYAVGLVFLEGAVAQMPAFSSEALRARASIIDGRSRLEFDDEAMYDYRLGMPDMSHSDARVF